jgi:IS30 family transposase
MLNIRRVDLDVAFEKKKQTMIKAPISNSKKVPGRIAVLRKNQDLVIDLVDFSVLSEQNEGHCYMLTVIEALSCYAWIFPLKSKESSKIGSIMANLVLEIGVPQRLRCDNGSEFVHLEHLARLLGAQVVHGAPYKPQTQGKIERFNGIIETLVNDFWNDNPKYHGNWIDCCKLLLV